MPAWTRPCRSWCSAPDRRNQRRCRCRWSPGSRKSTARRSSSRTAVTWSSIQLMPLVCVNADVRVRTEGVQPLLVFSDSGRSMGLVVDEIVDIVEDKLDIQVASDIPGTLGSAVVKGQATEIIDVSHFLPLAFEDWWRRNEMRADAL